MISPGAVLELLILPLALGIADLLEDHLLGGLGGDPAELDRRQRIDDEVADRRALLSFWAPLRSILLEMVLGLFDDFEHAPQAQLAGLCVELGADVVLGAVAGAGGALDRVLHRLDDDALVDQLLARDRVGDREQLGLVGADGSGCGGHWCLFLYSLYLIGALSAERRGGVDELVGQEQLGRGDGGKREVVGLPVLAEDLHILSVEPLERAGELLCARRAAQRARRALRARPSPHNP
jgi:hypothetical protein